MNVVLAILFALATGPEIWFEMMGGNVREDGLTMDLEAIKNAGLNGIHLFHIGARGGADQKGDVIWPGCENRQIPCLSDGWEDFIGFLSSECDRLGLALTLQNCPGWSQSGGPWIDHDHAQRELVNERTDEKGKDYRMICRLAFPRPEGELDSQLTPVSEEEREGAIIYRFPKSVKICSFTLPGIRCWGGKYTYHPLWMHVKLEAETPRGWVTTVDEDLPTGNWRDYVRSLTFAADEAEASVWRYTFSSSLPPEKTFKPKFSSRTRLTDWEGKAGFTLRSLPRERPVVEGTGGYIDSIKIIDLTQNPDWKNDGSWQVMEFGHINPGYVNAPAPPSATGWECDKLDPKGIESHFEGYIGRLNRGVLKK